MAELLSSLGGALGSTPSTEEDEMMRGGTSVLYVRMAQEGGHKPDDSTASNVVSSPGSYCEVGARQEQKHEVP